MGVVRHLGSIAAIVFGLVGVNVWAQPTAGAAKEVAIGEDHFQRGSALPGWVEQFTEIPHAQVDGPVVVLLSDAQHLVAGPAVYLHRAIMAKTPASLEQVARFAIKFNPAYESVQLHTLRLHRDGQVFDRLAESKITFLQRGAGFDLGMYTGDVTASIIIPDLRVGDVLEYEYTKIGANPVLAGKFVQESFWDIEPALQLERVTLWAPLQRTIHWRLEGGDNAVQLEPSDSVVGNLRRLRWERHDVARQEVDPGTPPSAQPWRYFRFSEFKDWDDVVRWADGLFVSAQGGSPELNELVAKFKQLPTDEERISAALSWVQQQVRYISLSFGESSHRPSPAASTLSRRYGDCKDKSALLAQMLRDMGIPADPVLVSSALVRGLDKQLPSPHSFDHAIVRTEVGGKTFYLDPTRGGQSGRLASMGQLWDGAQVLVVRAGNSELAQIKADAEARTTMIQEEHIQIPGWSKPGTLSVRMTWTGVAAETLRVIFAEATDDRISQSLLANYERRYPGYRLLQKPRIEDDKQTNTIAAQLMLELPSPVVSEPNRWVVRYEANNIESVLPVPSSSIRKQPFALPYKTSMRYSVEIEFPPEVSGSIDPASREYRPPGLYIAQSSSFRGNRAAMRLDLAVLQPQIEPQDTRKYMDSVEWLRRRSRDYYWVAKNASKGSTAKSPAGSIGEKYQARLTAQVERISASLKAGTLQGDDLATAYCSRAVVYAFKRDFDRAVDDLNHALDLNPGLPNVQECRATVMLRADRVKEAIDAYGQAIILGNGRNDAYFARGVAKLGDGQFQAAEGDFQLAIKNNPSRKLYSQIWKAIAIRREGKQPDADSKALAQDATQQPWPAPMLALMYDVITPEELLRKVDLMQGDEREMALVEAYHAIGEWNLSHGDKAGAVEAFRKAMAPGVLGYYEHDSSRRELMILGVSQ